MSNPDFEPERKIITAITNAVNAAITTSTNHGYTNNQTVCLIVPIEYGMHLNFVETKITVTGLNTFTCDLDTSGMDPFVIPIWAITNITNALFAVITTTGHNLKAGDVVLIDNVIGMTQVNGNEYSITNVSGNNITINVNSIAFGIYAGGGNLSTFFTPAHVCPVTQLEDNVAVF